MKTCLFLLGLLLLLTTGRCSAAAVTLSWDANTSLSAHLAGYRVYIINPLLSQDSLIQTVEVGPGDLGVTLTGLTEGREYWFEVTAFDDLGGETGFEDAPLDLVVDTTAVVTPTVTVDPDIDVVVQNGVAEGTATFRVSPPAAEAITVDFDLYGTDDNGRSYVLVPAEVTFPASASVATVDMAAAVASDPQFFARKAYLIVEAPDPGAAYQMQSAILPITVTTSSP